MSPRPRAAQRAALAGSTAVEPLDVLVVGGGGATGCGVAYATGGVTVMRWCCLQREGMLNDGSWCSHRPEVVLPAVGEDAPNGGKVMLPGGGRWCCLRLQVMLPTGWDSR